MKLIFADTFYGIALVNQRDDWHQKNDKSYYNNTQELVSPIPVNMSFKKARSRFRFYDKYWIKFVGARFVFAIAYQHLFTLFPPASFFLNYYDYIDRASRP
jgi:hypothetical protein